MRRKRDEESFQIIKQVFDKHRERVGIRQIKMILKNDQDITMSKGKIERIKKKYNLKTKIRVNRWFAKKIAKAEHEHKTCSNVLNRAFTRKKADEVYSTDITQISYGRKKKAYLAVFKDLGTKEIVSYALSERPDLLLVQSALEVALKKLTKKQKKQLMIHSDQGMHFTHKTFREKLSTNGVTQSMSRRGNCYDNAPVESFFGYLKDHLDLKKCHYYLELEDMVTRQIDYYNKRRPQEGLKKMPPSLYRRHLKSIQGL